MYIQQIRVYTREVYLSLLFDVEQNIIKLIHQD